MSVMSAHGLDCLRAAIRDVPGERGCKSRIDCDVLAGRRQRRAAAQPS